MATWVGAARAPSPSPSAPPPRARPRARPAARPALRRGPRARVAGGVVWIVLLALLLTGVVAMNVAVLRLNITLDRLGSERAELRGQNAALASQLSAAAAAPKIQRLAMRRLGLVPAPVGDTTYVDLGARH